VRFLPQSTLRARKVRKNKSLIIIHSSDYKNT